MLCLTILLICFMFDSEHVLFVVKCPCSPLDFMTLQSYSFIIISACGFVLVGLKKNNNNNLSCVVILMMRMTCY